MYRSNMLLAATLLLAAVAGSLARPSLKYLPSLEEHVEYTPTVVGHAVHTVPTAVSHQSQTIVHEKRPYLRPIVEHTPIIKAYTPFVKTYSPYVKTYSPYLKSYPHSVGWPGAVSYASPVVYSGLYGHDDWTPSVKAVYDGGWSSGWKPSYGDWDPWALKK